MLKQYLTWASNKVIWKSGLIYNFRYFSWEHDPSPLVIFLCAIGGVHPTSGNEWRLIQGVNFSYVPRSFRKSFADTWVKVLQKTHMNSILTWDIVKHRYPYIKMGIRRYIYEPSTYITGAMEIPFKDIGAAIKGTWNKDYSDKVLKELALRRRRL